MAEQKETTITSLDKEHTDVVDEINGELTEDISYSEILTTIEELKTEHLIVKIAKQLEVNPKYVIPLADHLILGKKLHPTCKKHGVSSDHFRKRIVPTAKEHPEGIKLLRELIAPYEGYKNLIDSAYYRALYREVEKGTKWACELWAKTEGMIKPAQPFQVNVGQNVNVEQAPPEVTEERKKEQITKGVLKLKPRKIEIIDVESSS